MFAGAIKDNDEYKKCLLILLDEIILNTREKSANATGVKTSLSNSFRSLAGYAVDLKTIENGHKILLDKLFSFKAEIKNSLKS